MNHKVYLGYRNAIWSITRTSESCRLKSNVPKVIWHRISLHHQRSACEELWILILRSILNVGFMYCISCDKSICKSSVTNVCTTDPDALGSHERCVVECVQADSICIIRWGFGACAKHLKISLALGNMRGIKRYRNEWTVDQYKPGGPVMHNRWKYNTTYQQRE